MNYNTNLITEKKLEDTNLAIEKKNWVSPELSNWNMELISHKIGTFSDGVVPTYAG